MLQPLSDLCVFVLIMGSGTLAVAELIRNYPPVERLCLGAGAALILLYLAGGAIYLAGLPAGWLWIWPVATGAVCLRRRASLRELLRDPTVRATGNGWLLLSGWCLGWHALVLSYSGGCWAGDWFEHYERVGFFLHHWPLDYRFIGINSLVARPPLANVAVAGLLGLSSDGFSHFQVFSTLLSTLVFLPLAALTQRAGSNPRHLSLLLLLVMLNPLVVENATFPWTKLPAAFFVLLAVLMLLRSIDGKSGQAWAGVMLAAGLLTHYSVAPWIIALGFAWLWCTRKNWPAAAWRRETLWGAAWSGLLLSTWFGWAGHHYGPASLVQATSTVGRAQATTWSGWIAMAAGNFGHTFVPNWNSSLWRTFLLQPDPWSRVRDVWFCLYQQTLPLACGLGGLPVLVWLLLRRSSPAGSVFWALTVSLAVIIGTAAVGNPVDLGVAHVCLEPLVLLALAWMAAESDRLPRWLGFIWGFGLAVDLVLGVILHFGVQSFLLEGWSYPGLGTTELAGLSVSTVMINLHGRIYLQQSFLFDLLHGQDGLLGLLLGCLLALACLQWRSAAKKFVSPRAAGTP
jgi:hypothetical protein